MAQSNSVSPTPVPPEVQLRKAELGETIYLFGPNPALHETAPSTVS